MIICVRTLVVIEILRLIHRFAGQVHAEFSKDIDVDLRQNDAGVDKWTVHTSLNHVDDETKITDTYIRKSWDPIDKANRKVLNLVKIKRHFVEPVLPKQKNSFA